MLEVQLGVGEGTGCGRGNWVWEREPIQGVSEADEQQKVYFRGAIFSGFKA